MKAPPPTPQQELVRRTAAWRRAHARRQAPRQTSAPGPALSPGPVVWAVPVSVDSHQLNGLACASLTLCVGVDNDGGVVTSTAPLSGPRSWHVLDVDVREPMTGISCPSVSECVAVDGGGQVVSSGDPGAPVPSWTVAPVDSVSQPSTYTGGQDLLRGVSCPSVSLCIAVDSVGNMAWSSDPLAGAPAWGLAHIDDNTDYGCVGGGLTCQSPLMGVSCPSVSLCAAVDFTGNALQTTVPVSAPWPSRPVSGGGAQSLWGVTCPTTTFCATVNGSSGGEIGWKGTAGTAPTRHRLPIDAYSIWCRSASLCLAAGESPSGMAELVGSTDPAAKKPAWKRSNVGDINAVSCPTASICLATDDEGNIMVGVTVRSVAGTLRQQALRAGIPRIGVLRRNRGYAMRVTMAIAGSLHVHWRTSTGISLAVADAHFTGAQTKTVRLTLTANGRALLKRAKKRVTVTGLATYGTNSGAVSAQRKITLTSK